MSNPYNRDPREWVSPFFDLGLITQLTICSVPVQSPLDHAYCTLLKDLFMYLPNQRVEWLYSAGESLPPSQPE